MPGVRWVLTVKKKKYKKDESYRRGHGPFGGIAVEGACWRGLGVSGGQEPNVRV